jgi:O-acetyl-ADP-ribose deacetylase
LIGIVEWRSRSLLFATVGCHHPGQETAVADRNRPRVDEHGRRRRCNRRTTPVGCALGQPKSTIAPVVPISLPSDPRIHIERGDIAHLAVDAIVNAANSSLLGGGGVDGAIHRAAGPALLAECRTLGGCLPGEARLTSGYRLPARHVIHTVGPIWRGGGHGERDILARCYNACLAIARERGFRDIAFPAIATGVYGFPHDAAATIAVAVAGAHLATNDRPQRVIFVCFNDAALVAYRRALCAAVG